MPPPPPSPRPAKMGSGGGSRPCPLPGHAQSKLRKKDTPRRITLEPRRIMLESTQRGFAPEDALIIDDHAPRNTADRDRDGGLAAVDVDHGDVIAEAIRHEHGALVARERDTPGALADQ